MNEMIEKLNELEYVVEDIEMKYETLVNSDICVNCVLADLVSIKVELLKFRLELLKYEW